MVNPTVFSCDDVRHGNSVAGNKELFEHLWRKYMQNNAQDDVNYYASFVKKAFHD